MQFLTDEDARAWAAHRGYGINEAFGHPVALEVAAPLRFRIPPDAGQRVALARVLWEASGDGVPEVLVWVTDWACGRQESIHRLRRRRDAA